MLLAKGYRALTRLLAAGYLEVVFTLNVDDTLDDELRTLKADEDRIWVYGEVTSAGVGRGFGVPQPAREGAEIAR